MKILKKDTKYIVSLIAYVMLLHVLYVVFYQDTFRNNYYGKLFIYHFNDMKYIFCILESLSVIYVTYKIIDSDSLTDSTIILLNIFYFIPGFVQQAVTDSPWMYMFEYYLFWIFIIFWHDKLKRRTSSILSRYFDSSNNVRTLYILTAIAVVIVLFMAVYTNTLFSVSNLLFAFSDVYSVRAAAKANAVHWIFNNLEFWAAYFIVFMICYYTERKRWLLVIVLLFAELQVFLYQANRIIVFLAVLSLVCGLYKINSKKIVSILVLLSTILLIDVILSIHGSMLTDIFRRYSIVPNRLSEQYYDYFLHHIPDFLRAKYPRIVNLLGIDSPYYSPNIGHIIGQYYYGTNMGANNGMFGGAMYCFGHAGIIVSSFGIVFALRLFEGVTYNLRNTRMILAIAVTLATISINIPAILSGLFSPSYFLLLYLSLVPISNLASQE